MHQPVEWQPDEVNVDGLRSPDGQIVYWGIARLQPNGRYACYAVFHGEVLAIVEVNIRVEPTQFQGSSRTLPSEGAEP
jgi:hypothetical protein